MSSLRNAVKRITHKERAQPRARSHLGILEKKKDYVERAKEFHKKEDTINRLKQKASMRNPDEFYFGMHRSELGPNGKHRKTEKARQKEFDETIGHETIRIMKDQDLSYVRMQRAKDQKKVEKLQASLHHLGEPQQENAQRKHTIFVESKQEAREFDAAEHFDTLPELVGRVYNRPRVGQLKKMAQEAVGETSSGGAPAAVKVVAVNVEKEAEIARNLVQKLGKERASAYEEMEARSARVGAMQKAEAHLVTEKLVLGKGRKRKIKAAENGAPAQYVWRTKRLK